MELINKIREFASDLIRARRLRYGLNAVILTVAIVGVIVMGNVVANDYRLRWDVTRSAQHTLSELTMQVINSLDSEARITAFLHEDSALTPRIRDLLEEYAQRSRFIRLVVIDPERDPSQAKAYGITARDTAVFEYQGRKQYVPMSQVFHLDQSVGLFEFTGEQAFTHALMTVIRDEDRVIYFTEGHSEYSPYEDVLAFRRGLEFEGFTVRTVNLGREGEIPEDAVAIVIAGPERDFDKKEIDLLKDYIDDNGRLVALIDPSMEHGDLPRLKGLLAYLGIEIDDCLVVDPTRAYFMDPFSPIPYMEYHEITEGLVRHNLSVVLPYARSLRKVEDHDSDFRVRRLLWASEQAWGETDLGGTIDLDDDDLLPPLWLGAVVNRVLPREPDQHEDEPDPIQPVAVVIGNSSFVLDEVIEFQGNRDLILNIVNYLAEDEQRVSIRPKDPEFNQVFMSRDQASKMFYTTVFGLPGVVLLTGLIVWLRRRTL